MSHLALHKDWREKRQALICPKCQLDNLFANRIPKPASTFFGHSLVAETSCKHNTDIYRLGDIDTVGYLCIQHSTEQHQHSFRLVFAVT